jgi:hypothetical protein
MIFARLQPLSNNHPNYLAGCSPGKSLKFAQAVELGLIQAY